MPFRIRSTRSFEVLLASPVHDVLASTKWDLQLAAQLSPMLFVFAQVSFTDAAYGQHVIALVRA